MPCRPWSLLGILLVGLATFFGGCRNSKSNLTMNETNQSANHLIGEKSPYLLQHAYNPVDWYPWGEEAFGKAREENKIIFLSIGYSTCHWCHVMEKESFEDPEVGALLLKDFISIKVDREERPDVDNLYMGLATAIGAGGGWPLNLFLTPDKIPFTGGTYFPPDTRYQRPGFKSVLASIARAWRDDPGRIRDFTGRLTEQILKAEKPAPSDYNGEALLKTAFAEKASQFEPHFGGFSQAPKFPMGHALSFLFLEYAHSGNDSALTMALHTLDNMAAGGIYDQLGGGFHRYSTDSEWLAPHFEKMLYDQALLIKAYLEAWQITGKLEYARVAAETIAYLERDMRSPQGGFYSAEDADSEGEEGTFYIWSLEDFREILEPRLLPLALDWYGVRPQGNWEGHLSDPLII